MITKTKTALIAAFALGSASAALAQEDLAGTAYLRTPNAPVPFYQQQGQVQVQAQLLFEGRNVAVGQAQFDDDLGRRAFEERLAPKN